MYEMPGLPALYFSHRFPGEITQPRIMAIAVQLRPVADTGHEDPPAVVPRLDGEAEGGMNKEIALIRLPDGSLTNHHRNAVIKGQRGQGGAYHYYGEALEVMNLVLKHTENRP